MKLHQRINEEKEVREENPVSYKMYFKGMFQIPVIIRNYTRRRLSRK